MSVSRHIVTFIGIVGTNGQCEWETIRWQRRRRRRRRIVWRCADLTYCYNLSIFMCFYLFFQFNVQYLTHSPSVSICNLASLCIGCWGEPNVHIILISCACYSFFSRFDCDVAIKRAPANQINKQMKLELKTKDVELILMIQTSTHLQWITKVLFKNRE